jgi:hypothetical protein
MGCVDRQKPATSSVTDIHQKDRARRGKMVTNFQRRKELATSPNRPRELVGSMKLI